MIGNYILKRKDDNTPIMVGDINELSALRDNLVAINKSTLKKRDFDIVTTAEYTDHGIELPEQMPTFINGHLAMATKRRKL